MDAASARSVATKQADARGVTYGLSEKSRMPSKPLRVMTRNG